METASPESMHALNHALRSRVAKGMLKKPKTFPEFMENLKRAALLAPSSEDYVHSRHMYRSQWWTLDKEKDSIPGLPFIVFRANTGTIYKVRHCMEAIEDLRKKIWTKRRFFK